MFWLLKKDFEINILSQKVVYSQLSYYDCLEFYKKITEKDFDLVYWFYNFLKDKIIITEKDVIDIWIDQIKTFFELYLDTACRSFFKKNIIVNKDNISTFESYLTFLSKEINLDPLSILKNYTPEQLEIITEWVVFNLNEKTKEWRQINMKKAIKKQNQASIEQNKKDLEEIKANKEKLLKLNNN